jgi:haloacetate dehalogenase
LGFFDSFRLDHVDGGAGATLRVRYGGEGPPVVLLHGHPRTHATWHRVAARLAADHTVVCPDLRGYGESSKVERSDTTGLPWSVTTEARTSPRVSASSIGRRSSGSS